MAASLILRSTRFKHRIDDSKKLTPKARFLAYKEILKKAWVGVGIVSEKTIDRINIRNATKLAMEKAAKSLKVRPDFLLIDGDIRLKIESSQSCIVGGDSKSLSIAAASIVAKVTRDAIMRGYHKIYPRYGFLCHKGYGTKEHIRCLMKHGPSPIHRVTFNPVKNLIKFKG